MPGVCIPRIAGLAWPSMSGRFINNRRAEISSSGADSLRIAALLWSGLWAVGLVCEFSGLRAEVCLWIRGMQPSFRLCGLPLTEAWSVYLRSADLQSVVYGLCIRGL